MVASSLGFLATRLCHGIVAVQGERKGETPQALAMPNDVRQRAKGLNLFDLRRPGAREPLPELGDEPGAKSVVAVDATAQLGCKIGVITADQRWVECSQGAQCHKSGFSDGGSVALLYGARELKPPGEIVGPVRRIILGSHAHRI